jgi:hypothetical protein
VAQEESPRIALMAYESTLPALVFVRVPGERGRYMLTDRCVVEVACPRCNSIKGEPCKTRNLYTVGTHCDRRSIKRRRGTHDPAPKAVLRASDIAAAQSDIAD